MLESRVRGVLAGNIPMAVLCVEKEVMMAAYMYLTLKVVVSRRKVARFDGEQGCE